MGGICTRSSVLDSKSSFKITEKNVHTFLLEAAAAGDVHTLGHLLKQNQALVNEVDYDWRSPLHISCAEGHLDVVDLLITTKANPRVKDRWGNEPLQEAMLHGRKNVVKYLVNLGLTLSNESRMALEFKMCTLASQGDLFRIKLLVDCGVSVNAADYDNRSALHLASACGHADIVQYLVDNNADVNAQDRWGGTAMSDAVRGGHVDVQKCLSIVVTQPTVSDSNAPVVNTAEHSKELRLIKNKFLEAAASGNVAEFRQALADGANVDDGDYDRRSALHLACSEGRVQIVNLLLGLQANVDVVDRWGNVPMQDAMRQGHREVVAVLRQAGARLSADASHEMELHACSLVVKGDLARLSNLVDCGVSVQATDRDGRSLLHLAVSGHHAAIVDFLIARSADPNAVDDKGDTPLAIAAAASLTDIVRTLEGAGGSIEASTEGKKPGGSLVQAYQGSRDRRAIESLPAMVAEAVKAGKSLPPICKECVSVLFSDIVGFTTLSGSMPAARVTSMLSRLFARFDKLGAQHHVQKVDIVGDAYLAATNFLIEQEGDHAARLARFALDMMEAAMDTPVDEEGPDPTLRVQIRVGLHCGPVSASVVGTHNFKYTMVGDTTNIGSKMESHSVAGHVQCSPEFAALLSRQGPDVHLMLREGGVEIKGKGTMQTYWVCREPGRPGLRDPSLRSRSCGVRRVTSSASDDLSDHSGHGSRYPSSPTPSAGGRLSPLSRDSSMHGLRLPSGGAAPEGTTSITRSVRIAAASPGRSGGGGGSSSSSHGGTPPRGQLAGSPAAQGAAAAAAAASTCSSPSCAIAEPPCGPVPETPQTRLGPSAVVVVAAASVGGGKDEGVTVRGGGA